MHFLYLYNRENSSPVAQLELSVNITCSKFCVKQADISEARFISNFVVIKQNESEVGNDMLLVSEGSFHLNIM